MPAAASAKSPAKSPGSNTPHGWTYMVGGVVLLASIFALAWRFRGDECWAGADRLALGCGAFGVCVFGSLFFATGDGTDG